MRYPELINRYGESASGFDGESGKTKTPLVLDVPAGALAVVSFYGMFQSVYVWDNNDSRMIWPRGIGFEAEIMDPAGSSPRPLQIADKGIVPLGLGPEKPTAVVLVPASHTVKFWISVKSAQWVVDNAPDTIAHMWLRALLLDASLPPQELLRVMGAVM